MGTPHINAKAGDFANVVLMPGDPVRAKWIADTFLHDYVQVTDVRGILGFTGYTKNGVRISVMASGMGQPSIGIYSYELFSGYDVDVIIRVGTAGSYQPEVKLFDIVAGMNASTDSSWQRQYGIVGTYSAAADFDLLVAASEEAKKLKIPYHAGNILSADVFYDYDPNYWKTWANLGVLCVEMESYALYCNAARLHKKALCLLTITDSFIDKIHKATPEERSTGLSQMVEVAIATAERFAKK
ncbi:MAG: purine-nucleoside phosphorylase [Bacilli bacterium]|nr:purine-nucleoside phosphorylase [Bacilli bacterium]